MATTNLTISGTITSQVSGSHTINITVTTANGLTDAVNLSSGFNTVASPSWAVGCIFIPPAGNAQTLTLKGVTGDTGIPLHLTRPQWINLASAGADIGITAGGAVNDCEVIWF